MIEQGEVMTVSAPHWIQVRMEKKQGCEGCNLCSISPGGGMIMRLPYREHVHRGDSVFVEIPDTSLVKTSLLVFILPILVFADSLSADTFRTHLIWITLTYFASGIVWMNQREQAETP